jgi:hypothetical protein
MQRFRFAESSECLAEIVLGRRPLQRYTPAGEFLEGIAIGGDRLREPQMAGLTMAACLLKLLGDR